MQDQFSLAGKSAVITGASRGIGKAIAKEFLDRGANIAMAARDKNVLEETAREFDVDTQRISIHSVDVKDRNAVENFKEDVLNTHSKIDILVNNAGTSTTYVSTEKIQENDWRQMMDVNLDGVFYCCQSFGQHMLSNSSGSIINISSIAGHRGMANLTGYTATKGAVELMTKSMALDWAKKGIRVNAIAYAFIETDLTKGLLENQVRSRPLLDKTPLGRFGKTEETTGAAVFLASDASSYVTGTSIMVDGGWTAA